MGGAIIGGIIIGMGAQIFVLPYLDSIAGFTMLFAVVTAIAAWIATSTTRLSYLGVQLALAFYLINLQEFTIQTSLSIARDRVFGVFLGLMSMWLIFDRLWVRNAQDEMQSSFARNLDMFAELTEQLLKEDRNEAVRRAFASCAINSMRASRRCARKPTRCFSSLAARAPRKLKIREDFRRWQPSLRTLLLVQIASAQYLMQRPLTELPEAVAKAHITFEKDIARVMRVLADEVRGKSCEAPPDIQASAANLHQEIRKSYEERGLPVPPQASDVISLSENLASILASLSEDIHATFATPPDTMTALPQYRHGEA